MKAHHAILQISFNKRIGNMYVGNHYREEATLEIVIVRRPKNVQAFLWTQNESASIKSDRLNAMVLMDNFSRRAKEKGV